MQAAVLREYGHEHITVEDVELPEPGPGEVRVFVEAASINPVDWHRASGSPALLRLTDGFLRPKSVVQGSDGAGTVEAVGENVAEYAIGDRVFGSFKGSFAGHALASVDRITSMPQNVDFFDAAALPVAGVTALEAVERGDVEGRRVVVNGASGGVGTYAVQIAKAEGATEVVAVCSARNTEMVRDLGADRVVNYEVESFTDHPFDVLIDCVGSKPAREVKRALSDDGVWVVVGLADKGGLLGPVRRMIALWLSMVFASSSLTVFLAEETVPRLNRLAELLADGQIRSVIDRIVMLDLVQGAYDYLETTRARGKVLVMPSHRG